jgi:uncharacterized protein YjbI with pentapeptide repeats
VATEGLWTLDELVRRVADALAGGAYPGAPNGRVRDVPDRRAVRWYATIGLVDRPATIRGRTALYGPRHLLQLVAVKRRQAQGRTLADIQAELAGANDAVLRRIADLPDAALAVDAPGVDVPIGATPGGDVPSRATPTGATASGATASGATASGATASGATASGATASGAALARNGPVTDAAGPPVPGPARPRFWADGPASAAAGLPLTEGPPGEAPPGEAPPGEAPFAGSSLVGSPFAGDHDDTVATLTVATLTGVPLAGGAVLLVPARPAPDDVTAIQAAARPLLDLLADRGLLPPAAQRSPR